MGPLTLVEAGIARGLTLTSYPSLETDLENAAGTRRAAHARGMPS